MQKMMVAEMILVAAPDLWMRQIFLMILQAHLLDMED
jgi:hypothetical protein